MPARAKVTREEILDTALRLADEVGLAGLTMRGVGDRLGVTPMALYRHVGDKQGLLDGLVERLLTGELPDPGLPWRERLHRQGAILRAAARRHPQVFPLLLARRAATDAALSARDGVYQALREAGVPEDQVPRVERLLSTFALGFAASEAGGRFRSEQEADADFAFAEELFGQMIESLTAAAE
ncbi:TetR/AcrR family transcriptional regulator C-terminal domain-containing protein [Micromonospora sp. NPDC048999]|uniref:TetR/AcrR family transcriptional regulator C-terminal domain-containing protein n=1 Tax=Micromonospora sp. NPDC048999 TaxID=3155391 RepID=UPI0033F134E8